MKQLPEFDEDGDLPVGIHQATLVEVVRRFGSGSLSREIVARRLERIHRFARSTGHLARFVIFGSFVTAKPEPNDVDIFMLMEDTFELSKVIGEGPIIFDHMAAQNIEGACVFGSDGWPPWAAKKRHSNIGKSNGTIRNAELLRW